MTHEVTVKSDTKMVMHKDLEVTVKAGAKKLDTLLISKGNIEWVPSGNSVNKYRKTWAAFGTLMEKEGTLVKVRRPQ